MYKRNELTGSYKTQALTERNFRMDYKTWVDKWQIKNIQSRLLYRRLAFVLIFPETLRMRIYLAGKTKINWKKNTWKLVNRVPFSLYTPILYLWILGKIYLTVIYYIYLLSWAKNNKMGQCWKWPAKKINNTHICSAHIATDKPS